MRRLRARTVQFLITAAAVVVAVNACAPTHAVTGQPYVVRPLTADPHSATTPAMDLVRLGGD